MPILDPEEGVWSCTAVGYRAEVCPKHVDPANVVNQNEVKSAKDCFLRFFRPGEARREPRNGARSGRRGAGRLRGRLIGVLLTSPQITAALSGPMGH